VVTALHLRSLRMDKRTGGEEEENEDVKDVQKVK
jgi:hypothetical protein